MKSKSKSKKRKRNCVDRMRHDLVERQRQRRGGDPAGKVLLKLLAMMSATLAILPQMPSFSFSSSPPRHWPRPSAGVSRKADLFSDDEDRGPTAYVMERGIDPPFYRTSSRAALTWSRLVKDLKKSRSREKAAALLEHRVPPEAVEWLRNRIVCQDWWTLRLLGRDDDIAAATLAEAKRWEATQQKPSEPEPKPEPDGSGDPGSATGLKP